MKQILLGLILASVLVIVGCASSQNIGDVPPPIPESGDLVVDDVNESDEILEQDEFEDDLFEEDFITEDDVDIGQLI